MAEPASSSTLSRWLPTMLGGLLALGALASLALADADPAPCECAAATDPSKEPGESRRRELLSTGARPHPAARGDAALAVEDQVEALKVQNELLAERAVTGEMTYYNHSQTELEAMARHCDVRVDYPKRLAPQEIEDLGLESAEQAAWERAVTNFSTQEHAVYQAILREVEPDNPELDTMTLAEIRRRLTRIIGKSRGEGDDALQRQVAEERAGMREPPEEIESLSAWNRYNRLRFSAGDRFAELLGDELGDERAHELRSAFDGWPGGRTRQWGCPGEDAGP